MNTDSPLSPHEITVLLSFLGLTEELTIDQIAAKGTIEVAQARSAVEQLKARQLLLQQAEWIDASLSLSEVGLAWARLTLPELRLWSTLLASGALTVSTLQQRDDMPAKEAGEAFGALKMRNLLVIEEGQVRAAPDADLQPLLARQQLLERIAAVGEVKLGSLAADEQSWVNEKRLRLAFKLKENKIRSYRLTPQGLDLRTQVASTGAEITRLTRTMLRDGSWQGKNFRRYNIGVAPRLVAGARNPYRRFLDRTKQSLLALGFEEMRGSLVENEFWNMDALFMPQFHPAREIHDVYYVAEPTHARAIEEPYLSNVAAVHEGAGGTGTKGWGYLFDRQRAQRLILRSQGTALSARQLTAQPKIPGKYFSIARCFRYDSVDATHAPDFFQIEGIILGEAITLRHLLGMLTLFAREIAQAEEVRASPGYYPYTEPSVEMQMRHPRLGWIELGGAGIFRPEVTQPLGITVPVIAWGLGLDRMAMMALGKDDIRHLFTNNLPNGVADCRVG